MQVSICMPAYNEQDNIEKTIRDCMKALGDLNITGEVVITDDCSKDNTPKILAGLRSEFPNLVVVTHTGKNEGYGRALRDAIAASTGDLVVTIDSDGQFDILELGKLIEKMDTQTEMVVGYRMGKKDSFAKVIADRILNLMVRMMFGVKVRDTNCAFKLIRGDLIRNLRIETNGFQTPTEILLKLHYGGARFKQVGVTHRKREGGQSSLKFIKVSWDFTCYLFYLRHKVSLWRRGVLHQL
jgi:glycosyltransferase involved in cell wall biosynthesis